LRPDGSPPGAFAIQPTSSKVFDLTERSEIPLNHGRAALVDTADLPLLSGRKWISLPMHGQRVYAISRFKKPDGSWGNLPMHRVVMQAPQGVMVDHIRH
jgi:hypothetical protein